MRLTTKIAAVLSAATLALTACASDDEGEEGTDNNTSGSSSGASEGSQEPAADFKVGMAYDVGGRGDQSFNDSAAAGLDEAAKEFGFESEEAEAEDGEDEAAREERLRTFADAGYNPVIAVGFAYEAALTKVAAEYPDTDFAIIDSENVKADNVANLVFAEEQGSFLVGAAAALKTETDNVGFVGGVETPLIAKFEAGFKAGVEAVNPDIEIQSTYLSQPPDFSGFGDPAKGKTAAEGMFDGGADIVYHAAGGSGGGVFEAAAESDNLAIGVDSDQYNTADPAVQDVILTSMLKNIDVAVDEYLTAVAGGEAPVGVTRYDLKVDGVGYSTSGGQVDDIADKLDDYKQQIIDGKITVPTS